MSIKARLLITISALIVVAFGAIGFVTVRVTEARMVDRLDDTLVTASAKPPRYSDGPGDRHDDYVKRATAALFFSPRGELRFSEPSGFADDPDPLPDIAPDSLAGRLGDDIFTAGAVDGSDMRFRVLVRSMPDGGYQVVATPLDDVDATVRSLIAVIALTGLAVLLAVIAFVWLTIRRGLRPIDDMISTAGLIAGGDLSHRVEHEDATNEVGQLGQALNEMLTRIETSFDAKEASERRLRQFVADASHELRTPLTSIRGYAELYRSGAAATPDGLERVMARIESEGARMGKLVEDLLLLARLDQGRPLEQAPVDLGRVVADAVQDARVIEPARPIAFQPPPRVRVLGDADRLRQVVDNLLANARVHTDPATPVRVALEARDDAVVLSVADEGPGIAPEDAAHVFDRFFRVDTSRSRARGGTGLGLAIVVSLVEAHGGQVTLDSTPGAGTTVAIALPRLQDTAEPAAQAERRVAAAATPA